MTNSKNYWMIVKTSLSFALFFVSAVTLRVMANDEPAIEAQIIKGTVSAAKWVWYPDHRVPFRRGKAEMYCRTKFKLDHPIKAASIRFIADDSGELFINGQQVLEAQTSKVGEYLRQGENIIAFHAVNTDSGFGLIFRLDGTFTTGENFFVVSDHNTKTTAVAEEENWAQLSFNDTGWLDAVEFGDASETPWSLYNNIVEKVGSPEEIAAWRKQKEDAFKLDAAFIKRLNAEPFYPASLTWVNEQPFIQINSCNYPPVLRLGLTPGTVQTDDFIFKMRNSHLKFYEVGTSPPLIRDTNGHLDFEDLEKEVNRILKLSPDAYVVLGFHFATNTIDWCKQNPDEAIGYATGPVQDEDSIPRRNDETRGRRLRPSPASLKFQKFAQECIVDFCEFIKKQPWKNRVIAIRPSFGVSAESMYYGSAYEMPDTGKAMTRQFREFLKKRYKNDEELRQAWHSEKETLENALPPSKEERIGANLFFRNPASCERKVLDYYECMHETMVDFMIGLAETVKKNLPGRLVGIYDGYEVGKFYPPEGEHTLTERLLRSPAIDFLSAPYNYGPDTRWAGKYGIKVHIPSTFTRYRKLSFLEADIRTYVSTLNDGLRHRSPLESVSVIRRDMMHNLFDRDGIQFHQFGGGYGPDWFNTPPLREEIDKSIEVVDFVRKNTFSHSISKIAVIYNSKEFSMHGPRMRVYPFMVELKLINLTSLALSGHIFDLMSLETFLQSKQSYATVVFLNTFTTNPQLNNQLKAKLRHPGVTAIWTYAPGLVTPDGFSNQNMETLTGIKLKAVWKPLPSEARMMNGDGICVSSREKEYPFHLQNPRIFCEEQDVEILARYCDNNSAAVVRKELSDGSFAVFMGLPITDMHLWRRLFDQAGNKAYVQPGTVIRADSHLLMVHSANIGTRTVSLPETVKGIVDVYNRKLIAENVKVFSFDDSENSTSLFYYGNDYHAFLEKLRAK